MAVIFHVYLGSLPPQVLALQAHFRYDYDTRSRIARPRFPEHFTETLDGVR